MPNQTYDITIIGAGVVGCALARHLSQYQLKICLVDQSDDVATGATKANSGIIHGAYATKHGTLKGTLAAQGNPQFDTLEAQLHFGFHRIGALVLAFTPDEAAQLQDLHANAIKNGSHATAILDQKAVLALEPNINPAVQAALWAKDAGVASPYEFAIALAENAIDNGVHLKLGWPVTQVTQDASGFTLHSHGSQVQSRYVVNAAGVNADKVAALVGADNFKILPRKGQYVLLDKGQGALVNHVLFQVPSKVGKGILVTRTCHGNLMLGPNAEDLDPAQLNPDNAHQAYGTDPDGLADVIARARKTLPSFNIKRAITTYSGIRAIADRGDFIIEPALHAPKWLNIAGIDSPGLTASPAIAHYAATSLESAGLKLIPNPSFNPNRKPIIRDKTKPLDPGSTIICRCEQVTEAEILDAFTRQIPIVSTDMIKRRTRAGMGPCQGTYCRPRIQALAAQHLNIQNLPQRGPNEGPRPARAPLT